MIHQFLFSPIYALSQDLFIRKLAMFLSYPATYGLILFALFWSIFYTRRKMYSFSFVFLTGATAWFASNVIKVFMQLPRPFVEMHFTPLAHETGFSFPSSHTTVLAALAFAVFYLDKRVGRILLILAFMVGISRIILGVHYPVDILGGFTLGYLVYRLYEKIFNKF